MLSAAGAIPALHRNRWWVQGGSPGQAAHLFLVARYKRSRYRRSRYLVDWWPIRHRPKVDSRSRMRRHTCREPGGQEWIKDAVLHLPLPQDHATMLASPYPPPSPAPLPLPPPPPCPSAAAPPPYTWDWPGL